MKENSIEEDIKNINKGLYELADSYELYHAHWTKRIFESIKEKLNHILSDYKRVLKENEELKRKNEELIETYKSEKKMKNEYVKLYQDLLLKENVIPVQKVKDIIDRIDYDIKKTKEIISNNRRNAYQIVRLKAMNTKSLDIKKRLQKLLESEE